MRFLLPLLFIFLIPSPAYTQFKNVLIDEASEGERNPCEPSIAISRKDPNKIVAGSVLRNVYYSTDGGKTWTKKRMRSPHGVYGDPVIISDFKGDFYYFHLSDPVGKNYASDEFLDRIVCQQSKDNGATWDAGSSIGLNPPKDQDKQWATVDKKGNLYVSWTQFDKYGSDDPACQSYILFSKSSNGNKWSKPSEISQTPGDCKDSDNTAEGAVPAVTNDGKVLIAWSNQGIIFLDRSFDGGDTWLTNDIALVEQPGGWDLKIPGLDRSNGLPMLMCDNSNSKFSGALYLVWADQSNGENDTDIWFIRSFNYGDNWTTPLRINNDGPGKHQFLPAMAVDPVTGHIYILYYDRRDYDDSQTDVYLAWSVDGGGNFKNVKISEKPFVPQEDKFFGDYLGVSASKGVVAAIWARMDEGKTSIWTTTIKHEELEKVK